MRRLTGLIPAVLASAIAAAPATVVAAPVPGSGCNVFPANNVWNADISSLPVNAQSGAWLAKANASARNLHPDWGTPAQDYGFPVNVVGNSHSTVNVAFQYASESDQVRYPFGSDTAIEGITDPNADHHALMLNRDTCILYELYRANWNGGNAQAGSGATFNLNSNALRPDTWTSADAAGFAIMPGLVRADEIQAGAIKHAVRFTINCSGNTYIWPARHRSGSCAGAVPYGARFRLKSSFNIAPYSPQTQVVLRALQHYGMFVADIGSDWYISGTQDAAWGTAWGQAIDSDLKRVPAAQFEAVDESSLMLDPNSGQVRGGARTPGRDPERDAVAQPQR